MRILRRLIQIRNYEAETSRLRAMHEENKQLKEGLVAYTAAILSGVRTGQMTEAEIEAVTLAWEVFHTAKPYSREYKLAETIIQLTQRRQNKEPN